MADKILTPHTGTMEGKNLVDNKKTEKSTATKGATKATNGATKDTNGVTMYSVSENRELQNKAQQQNGRGLHPLNRFDRDKLLSEIDQLPDQFSLCLVNGDKKATEKGWNSEARSKDYVKAKIEENHYWQGVGLLTGKLSDGLIAFDVDGKSAEPLLYALLGDKFNETLPTSVCWTSGKEGRYQILFQVPDRWREEFKHLTRHVLTSINGFVGTGQNKKTKEGEQLEIRYNNCQSILPPSKHPETGVYQWINSPENTEIAVLGHIDCKNIWDKFKPKKKSNKSKKPKSSQNGNTNKQKTGSPDQPSCPDDIVLPDTMPVPLIEAITQKKRDLVYESCPEHTRNDEGGNLAYNLADTCELLDFMGQPYEGDPEEIIKDFFLKNDYDEAEAEKRASEKWKSCEGKGKGLDDNAENWVLINVRNYIWKHKYKQPTGQGVQGNSLEKEKTPFEQYEEWCEQKEKEKGWKNTQLFIKWCEEHLDLKYNELTKEIEFNKQPLGDVEPYLVLSEEYGIDKGRDKVRDVFLKVAKKNSYHPVKNFLEWTKSHVDPISIDNLSSRYLGTQEQIYDTYIKKTLISAVARAYQAGAKVDTTCILQGDQGVRKSSFWSVLGGEFFDDNLSSNKDKDQLLVLHKAWIHELKEFETITTKKQSGELKGFLDCSADTFREPYGRTTLTYPRQSIIVGTVNKAEFLKDETGDRRFWIVPVATKKIDIEQLKKERLRIWSAAIQAYLNGETWWLDDEEEKARAEINKDFHHENPWYSQIGHHIENILDEHGYITTHQALLQLFGGSVYGKREQGQMAELFQEIGLKRERRSINGKQQKIWVRKEPQTEPQPQPQTKENSEPQTDPEHKENSEPQHNQSLPEPQTEPELDINLDNQMPPKPQEWEITRDIDLDEFYDSWFNEPVFYLFPDYSCEGGDIVHFTKLGLKVGISAKRGGGLYLDRDRVQKVKSPQTTG